MVGRESGDWGIGQTGGLLAEELGLPMVALVDRAEAVDGAVRLRRQTEYGFDIVEARGPVLLTITNCEENVPRIPKTRHVMKAYKKPLTSWTVDQLEGVGTMGDVAAKVVALSVPEQHVECELVEGDSLEEKVESFATKITGVLAGLG